MSFDYNSQSVDGLTSSTNDQASWIGDGWSYDPGYIERDYQNARSTSLPADQTGDLCWDSGADVTTLVLERVIDDPGRRPDCRLDAEADNGAMISYVCASGICPSTAGTSANCSNGSSTANGTWDGGYWKVTDPNGTSYYFGKNELPGYARATRRPTARSRCRSTARIG